MSAHQPVRDERYHPCPAGRHWGPRGAAGVLPFTVTGDGRVWVLLSHRSEWVQHGGTWSGFGGAVDHGETPWEAAVREASEEIQGITVDPDSIGGEYRWECPTQCGWSYRTFAVAVPLHASGRLPHVRVAAGAHAWETSELAWVPVGQVSAGRELHLAFADAWPALREQIEARPTRGSGSHDRPSAAAVAPDRDRVPGRPPGHDRASR